MASFIILFLLLLTNTVLLALALKLISAVIGGRRNRKAAVAFFHPYTNDGGGGERVLWCAVKAIQEVRPDLDCVIYTGDYRDASPQSLTARALDRFGVKLLCHPKVIIVFFVMVNAFL